MRKMNPTVRKHYQLQYRGAGKSLIFHSKTVKSTAVTANAENDAVVLLRVGNENDPINFLAEESTTLGAVEKSATTSVERKTE